MRTLFPLICVALGGAIAGAITVNGPRRTFVASIVIGIAIGLFIGMVFQPLSVGSILHHVPDGS